MKILSVLGRSCTAAGVILLIIAGMATDSCPLVFIMKVATSGTIFLAGGAAILHLAHEI